ncbi:hypothetical protein MAR_032518 [Mya arenaria]|uniref:Uncharacterized protein n=1 Tax=Mya arenaria TaxID=6604 RepID=A0ABY7F991_MYAAR|nr:hypothetical protein MAR_032518 [Mya arenaria]
MLYKIFLLNRNSSEPSKKREADERRQRILTQRKKKSDKKTNEPYVTEKGTVKPAMPNQSDRRLKPIDSDHAVDGVEKKKKKKKKRSKSKDAERNEGTDTYEEV